jgi:uncharacterized membrane protein YraQ (UPF0718 family)
MAYQEVAAPGRSLHPGLLGAVAALAALVAVVRVTGLGENAGVEVFTLIATSIVVEALPFVLLGSLVSALIEVYVPERALDRIARLPLAVQIPGAALGGMAFPVCECGSVPVARRLIARGVHPSAGVAFMLAAPIVNPVVLLSTWIAYRGFGIGPQMVAGRAVLGLVVAVAAGWALGTDRAKQFVKQAPSDEHDHETGSKRAGFVAHLSSEFAYMAKFVVIGAALAAALQTIVPQNIVAGLAGNIIFASLALMVLAFVLSLCSEADAFVAISFTQFSPAAQLAFLVSGPVLDMKLGFLYGASFGARFVPRLAMVVVPVVLAGALWFEVIIT